MPLFTATSLSLHCCFVCLFLYTLVCISPHVLPPPPPPALLIFSRYMVCISFGDIHNLPTQSKFALFHGFLNFLSNAPKFHSVGGGGYV